LEALKLGLFANARLQPRWLLDAFARVAASEDARIVVLAHGENAGEELASGGWPPLWRLYDRVDRRLFGQADDALALEDLLQRLPETQRIGLTPGKSGESWRTRVAELKLDVAFALDDFDDRQLDGLARYGVWRYWVGDEAAVNGRVGSGASSPACAREVAEGLPLTASGLKLRLASGGEERILYRSVSRTHGFSVVRNRDAVLHKSAWFAQRALRQLRRSNGAWMERVARLEPVTQARPAVQSPPKAVDALWDVARVGARVAWRGAQRLCTVEQWSLAYRFSGSARRGWQAPFTRLTPPRDRLWADPFPLQVAGRHFVFFEEMPFGGKGHISALEIQPDGAVSEPRRVLQRDYHLSYPFLLEHEGALYMIPETAQNRTVELYRCVEFPHRWKLEKVLMKNVRMADATLHRGPDRWWMFATMAGEGAGLDDELHLFHSGSLTGEWLPHPGNPVRSDPRGARPAGRLYASEGALMRPSQVCVPHYGAAVALNRVLRLSTREYYEREVRRIAPARGDGWLGIHSFNRSGDLTVIDGCARRLRSFG
jgi:hypothetical protein